MGKLSKLKDAVDHATRMKRAQETGFMTDMPLYHGTNQDIEAFDLSRGGEVSGSPVGSLGVSASTDPETAAEYANLAAARQGDNSHANVMQLYHRAESPGVLDLSEFGNAPMNDDVAATVRQAWDDGYDSLLVKNYTTPGGEQGRSFVLVKDPSQLRSVNAAFDSAKKDSSNLLASVGGAAVLGGAALAPEKAQAFAERRAAKQNHWKSLKNTLLESMAAINRGAVDTLNFLGPDQINAVLQLSGSDKQIPTFSDIPGVESGISGNYMEPGTARDVVRTGGEFLSPL